MNTTQGKMMIEVCEESRTQNDTMVENFKSMIDNTKSTYNHLYEDGFSGKSRKSVEDIVTKTLTSHEKMIERIDEWTQVLESVFHAATSTVDKINSAMMPSFEGSGIGSTVDKVLWYDNAEIAQIEPNTNHVLREAKIAAKRFKSAESLTRNLSKDYGLSVLSNLFKDTEQYIQGFEEFKYNFNLTKMSLESGEGEIRAHFESFGGACEGFESELDKIRPKAPTGGMDDLVKRAYEFERVLNQIPEEHRKPIMDIVYAMKQPYRDIFFAYLDKAEIDTTDGNHFSPGDGKLYLLFETMINTTPPYEGFFHEYGHMVDHYANGGKGMVSRDGSYADELIQNLNQDVKDCLLSEANELDPNVDDYVRDQAIRNIMSGQKIEKEPDKNASEVAKFQRKLQEEMRKKLQGANMGEVSDIYGGITNNAVVGKFGHAFKNKEIPNYWYNEDGTQKRSQSSEFFTHRFSREATGYNPILDNLENYLPSSSETYEKIVEEIAKKARKRLGK